MSRPAVTAAAALFGALVGWVVGAATFAIPIPQRFPFLAEPVRLPHHVPKDPGGLAFRFAMVHDVLHERFPKHGPAYYRERERRTREKLDALPPDSPERFPLIDDLAAGRERQGKSDEAASLMREKLAAQEKAGLSGRDLYTTYANLGTFLIHANFHAAMSGDSEARKRFREGIGFIRKSVEVNPEAHFGREVWQESIAEFLLAAMDRPHLLRIFDCLGNRLDVSPKTLLNREEGYYSGYARAYDFDFAKGRAEDEAPAFFRPGVRPDDPALWKELAPIRAHITKVGAEDEWDLEKFPSHRQPVPFDEPVMGMIGMWRQGGGANPHFALAMGETMLRVGQRDLAWSAFERASRLADRF